VSNVTVRLHVFSIVAGIYMALSLVFHIIVRKQNREIVLTEVGHILFHD